MLFAVGDIHGHFKKLMQVMAHCRALAETHGETARFIFLGDYIDRGPASDKVLAFLASHPPDVTAICGNHEELMLQALDNRQARDVWYRNGGQETLDSYLAHSPSDLPERHLDTVRGLPAYIDDGLRLFVHAGIDPDDPEARDPRVLLWTRRHPPDTAVLSRFIVHGHTPTRDGRPNLRPNRLNLDTGAGYDRPLTAAAFDDRVPWPSHFINHLGEVTASRPPVET